eukprot:303925_1
MATHKRTHKKNKKRSNTQEGYLAKQQFRSEYKKLLANAKNQRKTQHWSHKCLCLMHDIYPIAQNTVNTQIPSSHFNICQCGDYKSKIANDAVYRIGLNTILSQGGYKYKNAHFTDLVFKINGHSYTINLLQMMAGEIKKSTQPCTRKKILGTGTFFSGAFILKLGSDCYVEWRLKTRYAKKQVMVSADANCRRADVAEWWYQCWGVHGLREAEATKVTQFVAVHNNPFVGTNNSLSKCYERIVFYIHCPEHYEVEINGKVYPKLDYSTIPRRRNNEEKQTADECVLRELDLSQNVAQSQPLSQGSMSIQHEDEEYTQIIQLKGENEEMVRKLKTQIIALNRKVNALQKESDEQKEQIVTLTTQNRTLSDQLSIATEGTKNGFDLCSNTVSFSQFSDRSQSQSQSQEYEEPLQ